MFDRRLIQNFDWILLLLLLFKTDLLVFDRFCCIIYNDVL